MAAISKPKADLAFLCRALKAPSLAAAYERLAERARADGWSFEDYLAACLEREVASRQDHGGEIRIRAARFPSRKTVEHALQRNFEVRYPKPAETPQQWRHPPRQAQR